MGSIIFYIILGLLVLAILPLAWAGLKLLAYLCIAGVIAAAVYKLLTYGKIQT